MNTIIEKIRAEVERLKKDVDNTPLATEQIAGYQFALVDVQKRLSDLEKSEKPTTAEGLDGEITEFIANNYEVDYHEGLKHLGEYLDTYDVEEIARHFAQWGAEHLKK